MLMAASPAARAARWPLGFAALVLAYWSFDYSVASNMRRANPEAAYRARPTDPGAVAAAMNDRMVVRNQFEAGADDAANARAGLRQDPLNRVLLRTLGVHEEISRRQPEALKAMQMASRVSRRDSITELWLAEYHRRNAAPARALVHYDAAMLVRPDLQKALFPQMTTALAQPDFRAAVRPYIARKASWAVPFVGTAAQADIEDALNLVEPIVGKMTGGLHDAAFTKIFNRLVAKGEVATAKRLAGMFFPGMTMSALATTGWTRSTSDPRLGKLAWKFEQSGEISSLLEPGGLLKVSIAPLRSGKFASRTFIVEPGKPYRLSYRRESAGGNAQAQVTWLAECVADDRAEAFWQQRAPSSGSLATISSVIPIPSTCGLVRLTASAIGAEGLTSSEITIDRLNFGPFTP